MSMFMLPHKRFAIVFIASRIRFAALLSSMKKVVPSRCFIRMPVAAVTKRLR